MIFVLEANVNWDGDGGPCWEYQAAFSTAALAERWAKEQYGSLDDARVRIITDYLDSET
jgi:hypothetical protein